MRTARLVGLSPDGESLLVLSDQGEEFAVAADGRLRAAVCGDRARLEPRETQMETSLSPREIQTRIRSGASVQDVTQASGMPAERVERFAAPVLAEREYIAATAGSSSVRRRGETSGHRTLRSTVHEQLQGRDVDLDAVVWDASRREDGRWSVRVDYGTGQTPQKAEFLYDLAGRFSVAGDEQARSLLGERPATAGPVSRRDIADHEPTVDLNDELALIRATREPPRSAEDALPDDDSKPDDDSADDDSGSDDDSADQAAGEAAEPTVAVLRRVVATEVIEVTEIGSAAEPRGGEVAAALDTFYDTLGGDGYAEDSIRVYSGLSDATAIPEVDQHVFEPPPGLRVPVEPGADQDGVEQAGLDQAGEHAAESVAEVPTVADVDDEPEALIPGPAPVPKAIRRKRASVPSWDEIMFGGPKRG